MLRGGVDAGTARKLLWNVSTSVKTVACRSLCVGQPDPDAAAHGAPRRVVGFFGAVDRARLAVVAVLVEVAGT